MATSTLLVIMHSGQLLLDHQPLKRHQQQFNVELPWKDISVTILSGRFAGHVGIVKNAWIDFRGALRLSLWVMSYNCSIEIDSSAVNEQITGLPLNVYRPHNSAPMLKHYNKRLGSVIRRLESVLSLNLTEFAISPSLEAMRTGPVPWLGLHVDIVKGQYKGQNGTVKDVNRYQVKPSLKSKLSGLKLNIERHVFTAIASTKVVEVDYDAIRFHKTHYRLCEVFMPTAKQSFYWPEYVPQKDLDTPSNVDADAHKGSKTPLPNDFEREVIFCGSRSPDCPTSEQSSRTPWHDLQLPAIWTAPSPDPAPFRSPTPTPPSAPALSS
ncbi:hypothetical protein F5050DRAFT_1872364 [Lentinula boryana]|uniref:Uncharacterized protein n=1 Tax=Lentinula boryana TaxID=40481 RepID=A0ABQ8PXN9_9AGAR|nr:hypothetical protein F5050DRAFT_1872364 [Lentinula boryana]